MPGLRTPDTDLRLAAGAPFPEVPRVPTWSGPAEGPSVSDLRVQPPQVPFRANETPAARRQALRSWMRKKIQPTRRNTTRLPGASKDRPTAGTDAPARGERVPGPLL